MPELPGHVTGGRKMITKEVEWKVKILKLPEAGIWYLPEIDLLLAKRPRMNGEKDWVVIDSIQVEMGHLCDLARNGKKAEIRESVLKVQELNLDEYSLSYYIPEFDLVFRYDEEREHHLPYGKGARGRISAKVIKEWMK